MSLLRNRMSIISLLLLLRTAPLIAGTVDPGLLALSEGESAPVLVILQEQADLSAAAELPTKWQKGRFVFEELQALAQRSQAPLRQLMHELEIEHEGLWIRNLIWAEATPRLIERLRTFPGIDRVIASPQGRPERPQAADEPRESRKFIEWGLNNIRAPEAWAEGAMGQGAVVGSVDTGVHYLHPAIKEMYRGYQDGSFVHDYNWHDAVHGSNPGCNGDSPIPCDDSGHGTHTVGTMVGDDRLSAQIGVAPQAKWIACRCWEPVDETDIVYVLECLQWMLAPTDLDDANPNPDLAPHVVNNSWMCEPHEGCIDSNILLPVVQNLRAAGIVVVAAAGNSGPYPSTISYPPAIYAASLTVGATNSSNSIAGFSSRGPVTVDGSFRIKPDLVAPGVGVRSAIPPDGYVSWQGTSMAAPHVAGAVALIVSARPALAGDVDRIEQLLTSTATPLGGSVPNTTYGYGKIDVHAAVLAAQQIVSLGGGEEEPDGAPILRLALAQNEPNPFNPRTRISFELEYPTAVDLEIFDAQGRLVRSLLVDRWSLPGAHSIEWDGQDDSGRAASSGVYYYRLRSPAFERTRKMALVR